MKRSSWWRLSLAVSAVLVIVLLMLWVKMSQYDIEPTQLLNEQATNESLRHNWEIRNSEATGKAESTIKIKTGIFIQALQFFNSTEVNLSGYIWQRYQNGLHDDIKPGPTEVGFVLPEQVNSGSDIKPRQVYRVLSGDEEVIGCYLEATLRQPFDYLDYPFDPKAVWVRMWPKEFLKDIILVPDFEPCRATGLTEIFGIEQEIVPGTWQRMNTFFDYKLSSYDTNFGIAHYIGQQGFNVVPGAPSGFF